MTAHETRQNDVSSQGHTPVIPVPSETEARELQIEAQPQLLSNLVRPVFK